MFTGIVKEQGRVEALDRGDDGARIRIAARLSARLELGDSVAVNGVCLTAAAAADGHFEADAMNQTLSLTALGDLAAGDPVNLELALRAGDPLGGHHVQGHVDGVGRVASVAEDGFARRVLVELPVELRRYVAERGSVTLDGVSLTVSALVPTGLEVSLIPETLQRTTLGRLAEEDRVNVEVDVLARYVERLLSSLEGSSE